MGRQHASHCCRRIPILHLPPLQRLQRSCRPGTPLTESVDLTKVGTHSLKRKVDTGGEASAMQLDNHVKDIGIPSHSLQAVLVAADFPELLLCHGGVHIRNIRQDGISLELCASGNMTLLVEPRDEELHILQQLWHFVAQERDQVTGIVIPNAFSS